MLMRQKVLKRESEEKRKSLFEEMQNSRYTWSYSHFEAGDVREKEEVIKEESRAIFCEELWLTANECISISLFSCCEILNERESVRASGRDNFVR